MNLESGVDLIHVGGRLRRTSRQGRRRRRQRQRHLTQKPISCNMERGMVELRQWMKTSGFKCSLFPATFHDTGRGLMTKKAVSPGDIIISLPRSLLITTETVLSSEVGNLVKNWVPLLTPQEAISIFLIWEKSRAILSPWQPYVTVLPRNFTTPGYFSDHELSLLPISVYTKCAKDIAKIKQSYTKIADHSKIKWPDIHQLLSYETFLWSWYVINTRSVYYKRTRNKHLSDEEEDHLALAPFLDLLNHSTKANVSAGFNESTQCYEIKTFDRYRKHDQVFISYGQHDNHKLFIEYGFCIPDNDNDVYEFSYDDTISLSKDFNIDYIDRKLQILRENKLLQSICCSIDGVSWKLWTVLRTLAMGWDQLQNWCDIYSSKYDDSSLVPMATNMAKCLINKALFHNQQGKTKIQNVCKEDVNQNHLELVRTLTDIEGNILKQSLNLLK